MNRLRTDYPLAFSSASGALYGISLRLLYWAAYRSQVQFEGVARVLLPMGTWVMTFGFLIGAPFVMGWICAKGAPRDGRSHWKRWIFTPWLAVVCCLAVLLAFAIEGWICVVMALPIMLAASSAGGISAGLSAKRTWFQQRSTTMCLALFPLLLSGTESQFGAPLEMRTVNTSILIHAPISRVWENVKRVPAIQHSEIRPTWTHRIGFPLPVEATLDRDGIGGVRHASFEGGLLFIETINEWKPGERLGFSIAADTAHIPSTTLDEHVTIGGRYFDVLNGEYWLEPVGGGKVLLHLSSTERLNTDFNAYASLWTDAVMRSLQNCILEVVQHRCESAL